MWNMNINKQKKKKKLKLKIKWRKFNWKWKKKIWIMIKKIVQTVALLGYEIGAKQSAEDKNEVKYVSEAQSDNWIYQSLWNFYFRDCD